MTGHDLLEAVGGINDRYVNNTTKKIKQRHKSYGWVAVAAAFVLLIGIGALLKNGILTPQTGQTENTETAKEKYVDINTLIVAEGSQESQELINGIRIGKYDAYYEKVNSVSGDALTGENLENVGGAVFEDSDSAEWFRVSGHTDLQYLMRVSDAEYSLWKFLCFNDTDYAYSDVLKMVYGIESVESIEKIISRPSTADNTDEGEKLQEEIGTLEISDQTDIEAIYNILIKLRCSGMDNDDWNRPEGESSVFFNTTLLDEVKAGRYLEIRTNDGVSIDALKYTAITSEFYEYNNIFYSVLSEDDQVTMREILQIDYTLPQSGERDGYTEADTPIDENTYLEAREYSDEIVDLQNRIGDAMSSTEYSFITSSAILENPDRIHVTVNTQDEELINRLKSLNTSNVILEIEYSTGVAVEE